MGKAPVAAEPVELGDDDRARLPVAAGLGEGLGELRAALEGVRALARLNFSELGDDLEPLGLGEPGDGGALGVNAEPKKECRVRPRAGIKVGIGRRLHPARDAEQRAEGVEQVEPSVEAERELIAVGL